MKKNKKGFTLIELLAVIVILGLLMAIAIPSITRYITQSRKKTAVSTAQNYMSALINEVNALEYTFTGTNTVYAVPIECISVERGGKSPFGEWLQANNAYWAYVLIQYNDVSSSYTYGFTFKDSAGYGMYPTSEDKIISDGSQIQTGLNLTRPTSGKIDKIAPVDKWTGFNVNSSTNLIVLESASEGDIGNGKTTCTLCQKGPNYQIAEAEKNNNSNTGGDTIDTLVYFGRKYNGIGAVSSNGEVKVLGLASIIFYEDETIKLYFNDNLLATLGPEVVKYNNDKTITASESTIKISDDKKELVIVGEPEGFRLEEEGVDPIYFGKPYIAQISATEKMTVIAEKDGSVVVKINDVVTETTEKGYLIYNNYGIATIDDGPILRISKDRKILTHIYDNIEFVLDE